MGQMKQKLKKKKGKIPRKTVKNKTTVKECQRKAKENSYEHID